MKEKLCREIVTKACEDLHLYPGLIANVHYGKFSEEFMDGRWVKTEKLLNPLGCWREIYVSEDCPEGLLEESLCREVLRTYSEVWEELHNPSALLDLSAKMFVIIGGMTSVTDRISKLLMPLFPIFRFVTKFK